MHAGERQTQIQNAKYHVGEIQTQIQNTHRRKTNTNTNYMQVKYKMHAGEIPAELRPPLPPTCLPAPPRPGRGELRRMKSTKINSKVANNPRPSSFFDKNKHRKTANL